MPEKEPERELIDVTVEELKRLEEHVRRLREESAALDRQIHQKQLEVDVLTEAEKLLKKGRGVDRKALTNREKTVLIDALRPNYKLHELLSVLNMAKSSYCYQANALQAPDKYADLRVELRTEFEAAKKRYGYRRLRSELRRKGTTVSEKVIRRLMREEGLEVPHGRQRKYSSYMGEISPALGNVLQRDFHADKPNEKWLTDITEFHIPAGKVYLSPLIDCFDGLPVAWRIGTSPNAELANTMLDDGIRQLEPGERPIVHTDRGCHYRWSGWIERMDAAGLTRSMSKKGCSPDNAACEGFHGHLKTEFFYYRDWQGVTVEEFIRQLDEYLRWFREKRIKVSLGGMSPMEYRRGLGLAA